MGDHSGFFKPFFKSRRTNKDNCDSGILYQVNQFKIDQGHNFSQMKPSIGQSAIFALTISKAYVYQPKPSRCYKRLTTEIPLLRQGL